MKTHPVRQRVQTIIHLLLLLAIASSMLGSSPASASQPENQSGTSILAKVYFQSEPELNELAARLDVWEVHRPQGYVLAMLSQAQLNDLRAAGWKVELSPQSAPVLPAPSPAAGPQSSGITGFPCYRTLAETYARMQALAVQYPVLAQVASIGASWEKVTSGGTAGNDILVLKLTNQARPGPKPKFFLMAEIHARELTTAETALRFAEYLLQNYGVDPDVTWLLDYFEVQIVPMTNPDGRLRVEADLTTYWRKNTDDTNGCANLLDYGTDLNRNFSFGWGGGGASVDACDETYRGSAAASEPEVQALQNYLTGLFPGGTSPTAAQPAPATTQGLLVTLHSYAQLVLWPYGTSSKPAPNMLQLQTLGRKLAYFNGYLPEQSYWLYQTSGTTDDWLYGTRGIPAYTIEIGNDFYEACSSFEATTWPDSRATLLYAFKAARRPYQDPAGPEITTASAPTGLKKAGTIVSFSAAADATRSSTANGSEPLRTIQAARASLDSPPWAGGAVTFPLSPTDGDFDASVENVTGGVKTNGLAPGRHIIFIEAQDSAGNWGTPSAFFLDIAPDYLLDVTPAASLVKDLPGRQVQFSLTITNQGSLPDTYDLSAINTASWKTTLTPTSLGPLQSGASGQVKVAVDIPPTAAAGDASVTQLTAHSQGDPSVQKTISLGAGTLHGLYLAMIKN